MLKRNKVKHLNRNHSHRKAMINNMVTSLFEHERIESTLAKAKVVRSFAEKIITKAKKNLEASKPELLLHSKREVMRTIKDRDVVVKLFGDIAPRYKERNGGYTRILKLVNRASDNSEMALLELVDRKTKDELREQKQSSAASSPVKKTEAKEKPAKKVAVSKPKAEEKSKKKSEEKPKKKEDTKKKK